MLYILEQNKEMWAAVPIYFPSAFTISWKDKLKTEQKVFPDELSVFLLSLLHSK